MADFFQYLYQCAKSYIVDTHANGVELWTSVDQHIEFVLTHPNGWGGAQQAQMRKAAIQGGLVSDTSEGRARVHFVTEGEASLHFCIQNGLTTDAMRVCTSSTLQFLWMTEVGCCPAGRRRFDSRRRGWDYRSQRLWS